LAIDLLQQRQSFKAGFLSLLFFRLLAKTGGLLDF